MTNPTPPGQVPEALRLADECGYELAPGTRAEIAAELLRLHAENKALRTQQDDAYDHGPQAETVEEAARDVGKWLNERPNRPLDLRHVAMLTHHALRTQQPAPAGATPAEAVERIVHLRAYRARRIYVAGPMTGLPEYNFPLFNSTAERLRSEGWHVENPAEHGHVEGAGWADYLRWDISRIATCGAIYLLPGWSNSKGATLEVHIAGVLALEVLLADGAEAPAPQPAPATQQAGEVRRAELVPGVMHCAKCKFQLNRVTLCVSDGNAYAGNNKTEPCPNGCGPLWPVTWEQEAKNCWKALEEMHERLMAAAAPQPSPTAQAASSAVLKAIREANMQLVRTGDNAFMLVPYKVATAQAAESVPAGPRRKDMLWSTVKMQERHDQRIENIVSGLERIKQEHAGQQPQKIDECYGDCPTDSTTCTNPCRFDGRASRAPAESVWRDAEQKGGA